MNGIIQEQVVLVEVVLGLLLRHAHGLREGLPRWFSILDSVVVLVLGARSVLADVLILRELGHKDLGAVPSVGLREAVLRCRLLNGERQLSEGGVCLLRVKRLRQSSQVGKSKGLGCLLLLFLLFLSHSVLV